jgi:hypothetical protein
MAADFTPTGLLVAWRDSGSDFGQSIANKFFLGGRAHQNDNQTGSVLFFLIFHPERQVGKLSLKAFSL